MLDLQNEIGNLIQDNIVAEGYQLTTTSLDGNIYKLGSKTIRIKFKTNYFELTYDEDYTNNLYNPFYLEMFLTGDIQFNVELETDGEYFNQRHIKYLHDNIDKEDYIECLITMWNNLKKIDSVNCYFKNLDNIITNFRRKNV